MAVTLTQLGAFLTVVRRGSVTAAAAQLFVTQPSVSAAVPSAAAGGSWPAPRSPAARRRPRPSPATRAARGISGQADLRGANLTRTDFTDARLTQALMANTNREDAIMQNAFDAPPL